MATPTVLSPRFRAEEVVARVVNRPSFRCRGLQNEGYAAAVEEPLSAPEGRVENGTAATNEGERVIPPPAPERVKTG